ncbi:MAG: cytochrome P450 [Pseudorhodoplanes sp.]
MPLSAAHEDQQWKLLSAAMNSEEGRRDPYPFLRELHKHGELCRAPDGLTYVFGYDAVRELLRSPEFGKAGETFFHITLTEEQTRELHAAGGEYAKVKWLMNLDGPEHMRLRRLVQSVFGRAQVDRMKPVIQAVMAEIIEKLTRLGRADVVPTLCDVLPAEIIGALTGLPSHRRMEVAELSARIVLAADQSAGFDELLSATVARKQHAEIVREVIAARRTHAEDDLVTDLVNKAQTDGSFTEMELIGLLQIIYVGGYQTTTHMIGNGLVALLQNESQWAKFKSDPERYEAGVANEVLRFNTALTNTPRIALSDTTICGQPFKAGDGCVCLEAAANHDPRKYEHPEQFDISREGPPILTFGEGPHTCLGSNLARLEIGMVLRALAEAFPNMSLVRPCPEMAPYFKYRHYTSIEVDLGV